MSTDRLFTGDTLLIGGTGRTDLPTGDPDALYDSLFNGMLKLDPALQVFPAHDYKNRGLVDARARDRREPAPAEARPRELRRHDAAPEHRGADAPDRSAAHEHDGRQDGRAAAGRGGRARCRSCRWRSCSERIGKRDDALVVLDVREKDAFDAGHVPGAKHLPRGQLELRVNEVLPDPTARIVTVCEFGKISTLAAATLRELGFMRAAALDGGMKAWREGGFPTEAERPTT